MSMPRRPAGQHRSAQHEGRPVSKLPHLPFARPTLDDATMADVTEVLRSGWITSGPRVKAFEAALSESVGGRPVRVVSSATAALEIALELCGIGPGDEVITPAMTFFAAPNMIMKVGATPVFVDVRARHPQHRPRPRRRAHRAAHEGDHADALRGPAVRHGRAVRARAGATSCA